MKTAAHWQRIGQRAHHGICLPLFSLRSKDSLGIGEFPDLLPLIPWCRSIGFDTIQLLPLNDTGMNSSPYTLVSGSALNPVYLRLQDLPGADQDVAALAPLRELERVAWTEIKTKKIAWLEAYFHQVFPSFSQTADYQSFLSRHSWLSAYAHFMSLQEGKSADFYRFLQYHCFAQMQTVKTAASAAGIFLMGDLPILPGRESADLWAHPSLFHREYATGAPPDPYSAEGQNWGFPPYNREAMREERFSWWKERLAVLSELYHIYRIDHAVGLFRIWAIGEGKLPIEGFFIPQDPALWGALGTELLTMFVESCPLLPIAEDLGIIPAEVYPILKELGICGTKVLRWQEGKSVRDYEPFSLATVSTPDMEPLALWWKKYPEEAAKLAHRKQWAAHASLSPEYRFAILKEAHSASSFFHINLLQEYLALFPQWTSPTPEEEQINVPGTVSENNWTYRFRPSVEQIVSHKPLAHAMRALASASDG